MYGNLKPTINALQIFANINIINSWQKRERKWLGFCSMVRTSVASVSPPLHNVHKRNRLTLALAGHAAASEVEIAQ